jgi:hypothetical protein
VDFKETLMYALRCQYGDEPSGPLNCCEYLDNLEIIIFSRALLPEVVYI